MWYENGKVNYFYCVTVELWHRSGGYWKRKSQKAPLLPITLMHKALPFQTIAMDFIMKLPESAGYDSILTITNHDCTKMLIAIPCREAINAKGMAELFLRQIFPRFGLPAKIISNQDP